jgi:hypothetical protein
MFFGEIPSQKNMLTISLSEMDWKGSTLSRIERNQEPSGHYHA